MYRIVTIGLSAVLGASAPGQVLNQDLKLLPDDGAAVDRFGNAIAIADGLVAAGAIFDNDNGADSGSAYIFDAFTGCQLAKLLPDDGAAGDQFGSSIAIADGLVVIGANGDDDNGSLSGSAYLYNASTSALIAKLLPDDGAEGDRFGLSVAIADGLVVVGARRNDDNGSDSGSAYLFDASTGNQIAKLLPDDGAAGDLFGESVAIGGGLVAVGAHRNDDNGSDSGSAYLFDASTGDQIIKLLPDDGAAGDLFGFFVAIADGMVAVGAVFDDDNGVDSGSAYLFDASTGVQLAKLLPDDGSAGDEFGVAVSVAEGLVVVGAHRNDDNGSNSGSAYYFDASTGVQIAKLLPDDGAGVDEFGESIAIADGLVAVGARLNDDNGSDSGSAYIFDTNPCSPADLAFPPGELDFSDVAAFLTAFGAMTPEADLAPPTGQWDFSDVVAFLTAFGAGCP